jgi:putative transposon-encoded protein
MLSTCAKSLAIQLEYLKVQKKEMIISHKYKFIFIKTVKTAGTSIEVDLNKFLGPDDIATVIYPEVAGHIAQNYIKKNKFLEKTEFRNHMPALDVQKLIGNDIWKDYFKFCVEREPVSKVISAYSMLINSPHHNKNTENLSFDEYVEQRIFPVDTRKYTDKQGNLIVNKILRYENLNEQLVSTAQDLGFAFSLKSKAKSGFRIDVNASENQKQIIYDAFSSSNIFTGYEIP